MKSFNHKIQDSYRNEFLEVNEWLYSYYTYLKGANKPDELKLLDKILSGIKPHSSKSECEPEVKDIDPYIKVWDEWMNQGAFEWDSFEDFFHYKFNSYRDIQETKK